MCSVINLIIFIICSIILSFFDFKYFHIPLFPLYFGLCISIILTFILNRGVLINNLIGMILMFLFFLFMRIITKGGMGYGDIQYALYCGFISGFPYFIMTSLISSLFGILLHIIFRKKDRRIPFVPAMMVGAVMVFIIKYSNY